MRLSLSSTMMALCVLALAVEQASSEGCGCGHNHAHAEWMQAPPAKEEAVTDTPQRKLENGHEEEHEHGHIHGHDHVLGHEDGHHDGHDHHGHDHHGHDHHGHDHHGHDHHGHDHHGHDHHVHDHDGHDHHAHDHHGHEDEEHRRLSTEQHDEQAQHSQGHGHSHSHSHSHGHSHHGQSATYLTKLYHEVMETIPWVTLGVLLTAVLSIVPFSIDSIQSILNYDNDASTIARCLTFIQAALCGLATPLCSCGALPIAAGLVNTGIPLASVVVFLTASQSAGLDSAAITWGLLGPEAAMWRLLGAVVLAIATGLSLMPFSKSTRGKYVNGKSSSGKDAAKQDKSSNVLLAFLGTCIETAGEVFPTVLFGLALSTAAVHLMPRLSMAYAVLRGSDAPDSPIVQAGIRMLVLISALPLQLCEHSTVTFAAAIQKAGGSPGLAFAFLMAAPSTNLASLILLVQSASTSKSMRWSVLPRVATAIVGSAFVLSYLVDAAGIDLLVEQEANSVGGGGMMDLPVWYLQNAKYLCAAFGVLGMGNRLFKIGGGGGGGHDDHEHCGCDDEHAEGTKSKSE